MARNGSGVYSRVSGTPYVNGAVISEVTVNSEMDDIATALTGSLSRDGQSPPTNHLPMAGYKITGLGDGVSSQDAATVGQLTGRSAFDDAIFWMGV